MNYLRLIGAVLGAAAIGALAAWLLSTYHKAEQVDGFRACTKAAQSPVAPLDACDPTIRSRVTTARREDACEVALGKRPVDQFGVSVACGANVKTLYASEQASEANLADADSQLAASHADRDAAIARAEARATELLDRKASNDRTIDAAPRTGAGLVHCDARCLRDLAGS